MKILCLDIETSPNLGHIWDIWKGPMRPQQVIQMWDLMMVGYHMVGSSEPASAFTEFHDGYQPMLDNVWGLMNEADALLTYNGKRFDRPRLNTIMAIRGYAPPSPSADIDLDETIRKVFQFPSHSLDFSARQFGLGGKVVNSGYSLWSRCIAREASAWEEMRTYCIGDVELTEKLYNKVLPWIKRHPTEPAADGDDNCINCQKAGYLIKQGIARTLSRSYQRYRCGNCGKWQQGSRALPGVAVQVKEITG